MLLDGWKIVTQNDWTYFRKVTGEIESAKAVFGYVRRLSQDDLGISLIRDSRWALGMYANEEGTVPFHIVPGCQVRAVTESKEGDYGFITWISTGEDKNKGRYEAVRID